jgi:isoleucyl-tRNA synthetase
VGAGIMGRGKAFKNVICLGHILDEKGKKMSKSQGNIVEPFAMINKYGVDALRFFMFTVNAPGDSKNFDEKIVDDIVKKNIGRLNNVLSFYELYKDEMFWIAG